MAEDSEEHVLQQLATSEQRLVCLTEELASRDLDTLRREMEDEEVSKPLQSHTITPHPSYWLAVPAHRGRWSLWKCESRAGQDWGGTLILW